MIRGKLNELVGSVFGLMSEWGDNSLEKSPHKASVNILAKTMLTVAMVKMKEDLSPELIKILSDRNMAPWKRILILVYSMATFGVNTMTDEAIIGMVPQMKTLQAKVEETIKEAEQLESKSVSDSDLS